ncbi:MAG: serine/threonine protein kinase, partial [Acidobacteria bacterium]|nr:serine/threonine protein kinase [Acidobacteriota bacterium]
MSDRWQQAKELFEAALEHPPEERTSFLQQACGDDLALRAEVESLLEADDRSLPWIDGHVFQASAGLWEDPPLQVEGSRIGAYELVRELGRGGMGAVYLATRADDQFQQQVAIKVIKRGMDSDEIVDRFRRERQILASLTHPHITRLLDGGVTDDGLPYFVMEYIEGQPIDRYCRERDLPLNQVLELFRSVCAAVHHAHGRLVVHRDIKPGNVLVTAGGQPKLLDFGIAKLLGSDHVPLHPAVTAAGSLPLTPEYASPEQLRGGQVTTASDVYSLGVVLYILLCGRSPYRFAGRGRREVEHRVCEVEPPPPSAVAGQGKESRKQRSLRRQLEGDLDNIVAKALAKEPERRYTSAAQLEGDLSRHLSGLPVLARPDTLGYRFGKFVRRNRVMTMAAALVVLSLVAGLLVASWQARVAGRQRQRAREEAAAAEQVADFLAGLLQEADPFRTPGREVSVRELLDRAADRLDGELEEQPLVRARMLDTLGVAFGNLGLYDRAQPLLVQAVKSRTEALGPAAPETAESLGHLGVLLRKTVQLEEAEQNLRRALAIRRDHFGPESAEVATTLAELASVLRVRGDYDAAEPMARKTLALRRRLLEPDALEVAESLNDLALLRKEQGSYGESEALYREALKIYRARLGEHSMSTAVGLQNLADLLLKRGDFEEAISSMQQALATYRQLLGDDSAYVAGGLNTLAALLRNVGRYGEAEEAYREALALRTRLLGPEHRSVARTATNLAAVLMERG